MQYGLIGERLGHSFSREVHALLGEYPYELLELPPEAVGDFMRVRDFEAINVTIPYKSTVIPYLDGIDDAARAIGAVNTVKRVG
ncbi:MAG: shikimate dehydrogenase, partial [Clostridia bacterium]|nr:shikimate dehydrogenase [Clostridia bacterium]